MPLAPNARAFAETFAAQVIGFRPASGALDEATLERVFRELSRTVEVETPARDLWGNWDFPYAESNRRGELYRAWIDRPLVELRERGARERRDAVPAPLWPDGKRFALCLSHDVDYVTPRPAPARVLGLMRRDAGLFRKARGDRAAASAAMRSVLVGGAYLARGGWRRASPEPSYDAWLRLEDRHGFRSTFFYFPERVSHPHVYDCFYSYDDVVGWEGGRRRVREVMRSIAAAGWEVGLHGSYHSALAPNLLAEQKRQIEDAVGLPVTSTRQHWLHYDVKVTPRLQAAAGLLADSTQGFNRNIGFRAGTAFPYPCWDFERGEASTVLEVPQHVMDGALFTSNALEYDQELATRHTIELMDEVERVQGCLTLSWHPNNIGNAVAMGVYEALLSEAARRGAWGCSVGQLREWWTARAARIAGVATLSA